MKKLILILIFVYLPYNLKSANLKRGLNFNPKVDFVNATMKFIEIVKPTCISKGKYVVFAANILNIDTLSNEFCFSISYFSNSFNYKYVKPDYVFYLNDEIILLQLTGKGSELIKNYLDLVDINNENKLRIMNKLYPQSKGFITSISQGLVFCRKGKKTKTIFYNNSDEIPENKFIYRDFPQNGKLELIKKGK